MNKNSYLIEVRRTFPPGATGGRSAARVKTLVEAGALLTLAGCGGSASTGVDLSRAEISVLAGCPVLPGADAVTVARRNGVDFRLCRYTHKKTEKVLFDVYVGEHPQAPEGLRYGGTTRTDGRDLVWFHSAAGGRGGARVWYTYLPTGSPRGTVMVVDFTTRHRGEFEAMAALVAHLQTSF